VLNLTAQNLLELWAAITRPVDENGLGFTDSPPSRPRQKSIRSCGFSWQRELGYAYGMKPLVEERALTITNPLLAAYLSALEGQDAPPGHVSITSVAIACIQPNVPGLSMITLETEAGEGHPAPSL
jgi:hypothetical protein